ncbi:hypothetical protein [Bradyrhizobium sp. CCBAU 51745]|uniref:hypothetical protein n=1 Tax=Bradyrhizobium sp. CCBAU 51745 TaxID=1325099 RepID=UPI002306D821|nr:hypothetical protein [Bradyrhizobium sp. CCBAU 51745]
MAGLIIALPGPCEARDAKPVARPDAERGATTGIATGIQAGPTGSAQKDDHPPDAGACAAQHPLLLSKYRKRPDWPVAGVDFCVGYAVDTVLKDPATISLDGASVDTKNHIVTLTGSNVTLDGYDFSLDGGWQVRVKASGSRIVNSQFVVGSNDLLPIVGSPEASDLDISHCTIDGAEHDPPPWGTMVAYSGVDLTIEYSWLKNSGGDMIQQIGGTGSIVIEHNLIENGGLSPGTHGDYTQLEGGPFTVAINYNTTLQSRGTTQGLMTEYVAEGEIGHNTMIGTVSYFVSVDLSSIRTTFTVHDNYFDPRGYGFAYPSRNTGTPNDSSPKSIFTNNVNMRTGVVLQDAVRR